MNIENFAGGMMSAAAFTRLRDITAVDAADVQHDDEGALLTRNGYKQIPSDNEGIVSIFAHWGYVLAVTAAGELKWDTEHRLLNAQQGDSLFRSFIPARAGFDVSSPTRFIADENVVFLSNANVQLKVGFENGESPVAYPFYLPTLGLTRLNWRVPQSPGDMDSVNLGHPRSRYQPGRDIDTQPDASPSADSVYVRLQVVKTLSQDTEHFFDYPIEAVGRSVVSASRIPNNVVLEIVITAEDLEANTDADYIDIFQTESVAENAYTTYYFIGRIPYAVGTYQLGVRVDNDLIGARELVEPFDEPVWQFAVASDERLYLNTGTDDRIWMTHYEADGGKYLRTLRDYIPVKTGGFPITGLKKLEQNLLAVYTENRIFLLNIDPIPELHRIVSVMTTRDDKDTPIGCIASESLVDINGSHYFLSGNQQVYKYDGQRISWVSDTINPTLAKMPKTPAKKAIGFARGLVYCLSYPSTPESTENDAILRYDSQRKIWWKDSIGISEISKGRTQSEFALVERRPVWLNVGRYDNREPIGWFWRGNKVLIPLNTLIHSLFVGVLPEDVGAEAVEISVTLKTEEGEQTETLQVGAAIDYWNQIVGFNLRGRSVQVTLSGSGVMKIDRLIFNPTP